MLLLSGCDVTAENGIITLDDWYAVCLFNCYFLLPKEGMYRCKDEMKRNSYLHEFFDFRISSVRHLERVAVISVVVLLQ